ncbi:hypothetical protein [Vibrio parahaemolyticus]|uniref:hypothetical protein n=1 Tax=Vibrio parahaemolyticus TaxID=670 RepID=UPI000813675D|nr:hypothetical protein [Vibrio parahaemolyticus]OCP68396.1 hypothetical protein AKH08_16425 [Vibrio parahaemolyticus]
MQSARLGRTIIATSVCLILASPMVAIAEDEIDSASIVLSTEQTNMATVKLMTLQQAVSSYYAANLRWPNSLTDLTTGANVYFVGDFSTPFGNISGVKNSENSYSLQINVPANPTDYRRGQYETLAGNVGGDYASNRISFSIPVPYAASVKMNMLQRTEDTSGSGLNEMLASLSLGNNDITNIQRLVGDNIELSGDFNVSTVEAIDASVDTAEIDTLNVNVSGDIEEGVADTANIAEFVVNDTLKTEVLTFGSLDLGELTVSDNAIVDNVTITKRATLDYLDADRVEFDYGNFTASLSAVNAEVHTLTTDGLRVDRFIGPVRFNSPVAINDVTQALGTFTVNGQLTQKDRAGNFSLGNTKVNGNLTTIGAAQFDSNVKVTGSFTAGSADFTQSVNVNGRTSLDDLRGASARFSNKVIVKGKATVNQQLRISGDLIAGNRVVARNGIWYENGQKVTDRYYGINSKVSDADKLSGVDSSKLAVKSRNNVFNSTNTFRKNIYVTGAVRSGAGVLVDASGRLYDQGVLFSSKYAKQAELTSAEKAINDKIAAVESQINSAVNSKQSQLTSYRTQLNGVITQQNGIDSTNNESQKQIDLARTYLQQAESNYNTSNTALSGSSQKVSSLTNLANQVNSMDAFRTTVIRKTNTIYKRANTPTVTYQWTVVGTTCFTASLDYKAVGASCSTRGAKARGNTTTGQCNLSNNPVNPSWGPKFELLECK